ncbi:MAG: alpha/beta fold hydrolase [Calditrichaceae bacterium]
MKLFYRKFGKGKPVIILHGLFGMSDNWMTIGKKIAERHTVYIPDQRNHGRSTHSVEFSYDLLVNDLAEFAAEHNLNEIRLIGHSMGGKVAMQYALKYPQKVEKLVVVDIAPKNYYNTYFKMFLETLSAINLDSLMSREEADTRLSVKIKQKPIRQFLLKNLRRNRDGTFSWKANLPSIYQNIDEILQGSNETFTFENPTLFIKGGRSEYILPADFPLIRRIFPNSEIVTIDDATHWIHSDAPDEFCGHLRTFFG